jgi:hypothetical protein
MFDSPTPIPRRELTGRAEVPQSVGYVPGVDLRNEYASSLGLCQVINEKIRGDFRGNG